jgi:UDP-N-acetyl-D-galactosamine dehydrogenase
MNSLNNLKICVIGMGYVGLPLALELSKHFSVIGFEINIKRLNDLKNGIDSTNDVEEKFSEGERLLFSNDESLISACNCFLVTVPTPVDFHKQPDFQHLISASKLIGKFLKKNDLVIYESTVYPGATEEKCVPELEKASGLIFNHDFFVGYSPERINPGDKANKLTNIKKITSGSTPEIAILVDSIYKKIIKAGTYSAESIKIAEAAKVIENIQRDTNIALINELAILFNRLEIDTNAVLRAAETKWNFMPFRPGLVGGHCIGVDPYYLIHKGQAIGYYPEIILAARRINDNMSSHIVSELIKHMIKSNIQIRNSKILVLGLSFKENCADIRNTRVIEVVEQLKEFDCNVDIYDPVVSPDDVLDSFKIKLIQYLTPSSYDAILLAVAHDKFKSMGAQEIRALGKINHILYDVKSIFSKDQSDLRL